MQAREAVRWALLAAYTVLWTGGIATRCLMPGAAQPAWTAPTFLLIAAVLAALGSPERLPLLIFGAGGFLAELAGVHTGLPFGRYSYSAALGPSLGGVPLVIACAWITLLLFARDLAFRATFRKSVAVLMGAAIMMAATS